MLVNYSFDIDNNRKSLNYDKIKSVLRNIQSV